MNTSSSAPSPRSASSAGPTRVTGSRRHGTCPVLGPLRHPALGQKAENHSPAKTEPSSSRLSPSSGPEAPAQTAVLNHPDHQTRPRRPLPLTDQLRAGLENTHSRRRTPWFAVLRLRSVAPRVSIGGGLCAALLLPRVTTGGALPNSSLDGFLQSRRPDIRSSETSSGDRFQLLRHHRSRADACVIGSDRRLYESGRRLNRSKMRVQEWAHGE